MVDGTKFFESESYKKATECQKRFFNTFFEGYNICLSGQAGTGKSWAVNELCKFLEAEGEVCSARTALTGIAAINIGGSTIHSFAGIGLAEGKATEIIKEIVKKRWSKAPNRIRSVQVLFIDEISMASAELLDKLDQVFRHFRHSNSPFGGVQVVMIGDFLQLPPVFKAGFGESKPESFAFESQYWKQAKVKTVLLTEIVRQKDRDFANLLNRIRVGDRTDLTLLNSRVNAKVDGDSSGIKPVLMFCKNVDVDKSNDKELDKLPGEEQKFFAITDGAEQYEKFFDKNCLAPKILRLKKGAQVMLLSNCYSDEGLINGSIGIVQDFSSVGPTVLFKNGVTKVVGKYTWEIKEKKSVGVDSKTKKEKFDNQVVASRKQIPLKLAWACTVHKTQGQTLDAVNVDISQAFEFGQAYTALSRVRSLEGLSLKPFDSRVIKAHPACLEFYVKTANLVVDNIKKVKNKEEVELL